MLNKLYYILFFLMFTITGCTRDDICAGEIPKTPLMVVTFYDFEYPDERKAVTNFSYAIAQDTVALMEPTTLDSIAFSLNTSQDFTEYLFAANATDSTSFIDQILFTYNREEEYINRACAFRTNFTHLTTELTFINPLSWIAMVTVVSDTINIRNPDETHIHIYH